MSRQSLARFARRAEISEERRRGYKLDAYNEKLAERNETLHPTRGFRKINPKRTRAGTIMEMTMDGFGMSTTEMKEALQSDEYAE